MDVHFFLFSNFPETVDPHMSWLRASVRLLTLIWVACVRSRMGRIFSYMARNLWVFTSSLCSCFGLTSVPFPPGSFSQNKDTGCQLSPPFLLFLNLPYPTNHPQFYRLFCVIWDPFVYWPVHVAFWNIHNLLTESSLKINFLLFLMSLYFNFFFFCLVEIQLKAQYLASNWVKYVHVLFCVWYIWRSFWFQWQLR